MIECIECKHKNAEIATLKEKIKNIIKIVNNVNQMKSHLILLIKFRDRIYRILKDNRVIEEGKVKSLHSIYNKYQKEVGKLDGEPTLVRKYCENCRYEFKPK